MSQSLFYWIIYSYSPKGHGSKSRADLNVSILILLDYLFLLARNYNSKMDKGCLNPYFIGLSILMGYVSL